jgi:PAS domain S-box-containing protein
MHIGRLERLTHACFLLVCGVSLAVLASWWLDLGDWTLPGRIARPMAPTAAFFFLALTSVAWGRHLSHRTRMRWVALAVGLGVAAFSLVSLLNLPWEAASALPRGVMVPITALVFLFIGLTMTVDAVPLPANLPQQLDATVGLLVAFSGVAIVFGHVLNVPFVAGQPLPALFTGCGFFLFGLGLAIGTGARSWPALRLRPTASAQARGVHVAAWLVTLVCVLAFLGALGTLVVRSNYRTARENALRLAGTAADAEAAQISDWFRERQGDAEVLRQTPLADILTRDRADLQSWLASLARHYGYRRVALTDSSGRLLLADGEDHSSQLDAPVAAAMRAAVTSGAVQFVDRSWSKAEQALPLSWVVPLGDIPPAAVLVLSTNLARFGQAGHAVNVMVVGHGDDRTIAQQGIDVVSAVSQVAGTPWAVTTRVNQDGVYAAANETTLIMGVSLAACGLAVMLAVGLLWYRRELRTTEHIVDLAREQAKTDDLVRTLSTVVAQSPVSIVITDMTGTISYVNPMFTQVTGYTADEAIGQNPRMLQSGTMSEDGYSRLWDTILGGRVWQGELHNKRKNGEFFWESATISPLRDGAGHPTGFVAVKREITADKIAQEAHARLQLEFVQAQKMESVGRLAGGVAHDFNNMLAVILGHAELAIDDLDDDSPLREHLVEILQAGQRSSDLTQQLLAFARKQKANPKVVDLNHEVAKTLKMLKRLIGENIDLMWNPADTLWPVFIDPAQVNQILANVAVNARDAISGIGTITIETANVTVSAAEAEAKPALRPGTFVRLSIYDTGCGMSPDVLAHLFEPFFTTKEEGKGTGLGTATVYGIVTQCHGAIDVASAVGVGTSMHIYLPRAGSDEGVDTEEAAGALPRGSETILVVEDEAAMLSICTRMLRRLGYTVLACPTSAEALAVSETHQGPLHAVLADVVMPVMNGRDLVTRIAQRHPGIRIVFMSGYTIDVISEQGVFEGSVHFLPKPFSVSQLAVKMKEVFA